MKSKAAGRSWSGAVRPIIRFELFEQTTIFPPPTNGLHRRRLRAKPAARRPPGKRPLSDLERPTNFEASIILGGPRPAIQENRAAAVAVPSLITSAPAR